MSLVQHCFNVVHFHIKSHHRKAKGVSITLGTSVWESTPFPAASVKLYSLFIIFLVRRAILFMREKL